MAAYVVGKLAPRAPAGTGYLQGQQQPTASATLSDSNMRTTTCSGKKHRIYFMVFKSWSHYDSVDPIAKFLYAPGPGIPHHSVSLYFSLWMEIALRQIVSEMECSERGRPGLQSSPSARIGLLRPLGSPPHDRGSTVWREVLIEHRTVPVSTTLSAL